MQPTGDKIREVLLPYLAKMGIKSTYSILNHGVFPDVMGGIETTLQSLPPGDCL